MSTVPNIPPALYQREVDQRMAQFKAGYDAGRHNRVVVLSDDPDWLDGFITGRADAHNA